jgi:hypothetical protein
LELSVGFLLGLDKFSQELPGFIGGGAHGVILQIDASQF